MAVGGLVGSLVLVVFGISGVREEVERMAGPPEIEEQHEERERYDEQEQAVGVPARDQPPRGGQNDRQLGAVRDPDQQAIAIALPGEQGVRWNEADHLGADDPLRRAVVAAEGERAEPAGEEGEALDERPDGEQDEEQTEGAGRADDGDGTRRRGGPCWFGRRGCAHDQRASVWRGMLVISRMSSPAAARMGTTASPAATSPRAQWNVAANIATNCSRDAGRSTKRWRMGLRAA